MIRKITRNEMTGQFSTYWDLPVSIRGVTLHDRNGAEPHYTDADIVRVMIGVEWWAAFRKKPIIVKPGVYVSIDLETHGRILQKDLEVWIDYEDIYDQVEKLRASGRYGRQPTCPLCGTICESELAITTTHRCRR